MAALALAVGGLTACSPEGGDVAACETFDKAMSNLDDVESDAAAARQVAGGASRAADLADSPQLSDDLRAFGVSYSALAEGPDDIEAQLYTSFAYLKTIMSACEAAGAKIPNLQELSSELGLDELTLEDLEELADGSENSSDEIDFSDFENRDFNYDLDALANELMEAEGPDITTFYLDCTMGDMPACDTLYELAPPSSELQRVAADCGGFKVGSGGGNCAN